LGVAQLQNGYEIAGYRLGDFIGAGAKGSVYRATKNNQQFALKVITGLNQSGSGEVLNFNRETAVAARFRHPVITRVHDFGQEGDFHFIAMELADGITLQEKLQREGRLETQQVLSIGIALSSALQEVHNFGFVHRDIKPENVVLCKNGDIKLIDFGLAGSIADLSLPSTQAEAIGTFDYSSPEQSGVLNRSVDGRSDLYSVGVVMYQCLAGSLPFVSSDLSELLSLHARQKPRSVRELNPSVSEVLEKIIEKLLLKNPDDRYQSAAGLIFDLQNIAKIQTSFFETKEIRLATQDLSVGGAIRLPLFGREQELTILRTCFQLALEGKGRCVSIEGEGGLGKSRLARELIADADRAGILVLTGKCSAQEKDIPYAVLKQALEQHLFRISQLPEEQRLKSEGVLREAAAHHQAIVLALNASLQSILGEHSPQEGQIDAEMFRIGIRNFFCELAARHHGLVLHLDDIQWMDAGSLAILKSIFDILNEQRMFILATARNDRDSLQSLEKFVRQGEAPTLVRLALKPLNLLMTSEIIRSFLGGHDVASNISEKLFAFSNGNPFILTENLSRLMSSGVLRLLDDRWQLNELDFARVGLSENVYDLILERIAKLGARAQDTLKVAAAIGHSFDHRLLAKTLSIPEDGMKDTLILGLRANIIELQENATYRFVHDRIREALLSALDPDSSKDIYEKLTDVLEQDGDADESRIYDLARYASLGHADRNPYRTFHALMKAGQIAYESNASQQAADFFMLAGLYEGKTQIERSTHLKFLMDYASTSTELGQVETSYRLLDRALKLTQDPLEVARILNLKSKALTHVAQYTEAWDSDVEILRQLGQKFPDRTGPILVSVLVMAGKHLLLDWHLSKSTRTESAREHCVLSATIYERMIVAGTFTGKKAAMILIGFRFLFYARQIGPSILLVRAHGYMAQMTGVLSQKRWMDRHIRKASEIAQMLGSKTAILISNLTEAIARERIGEDVEAEKLYVAGLPDIEKILNTLNFSLVWGSLGWFYFLRGKNHQSVAIAERNLPRTDSLNRLGSMVALRFMLYYQYMILGRLQEADEVYQFIKDKIPTQGPGNTYVWSKFRASEFVRMYELDEISPDIDAKIQAFENYKFDTIHHHLYYAYIGYIRQYQIQNATDAAARSKAVELLAAQLKSMKKIMNRPFSQSHYFILRAAYLRSQNKFSLTGRSLKQAEKLAQISGSEYATFMLLKEKSRLARDEAKPIEARLFSRMAYEMAVQHGWSYRATQVAKEFNIEPSLLPVKKQNASAEVPSRPPAEDRIAASLLRISLVASFEMNSEKQIRFSLDEIVKVMGAERSYVFLTDPQGHEMKYAGGRDHQLRDLEEPTGYSSTVVQKVAETKQPLAVMGNDQMEALGSTSAVIHGLRSIISAPLLLKGELKGVVYVDSSVQKILFTEQDTHLLTAIANYIAIAFENLRVMNVEAAKREMQKDLELSATVQSMMFPKDQQILCSGVRIAGFNRPAVQCGGDWWWHEMIGAKTLRIFVGDVTGHGAGPAMITAFVAACFQFCHQVVSDLKMPELLENLNRLLFDLTSGEYLVSSAAIEIDTETKTLSCWNSGSPGIYILRKNGEIESVGRPGSLLGSDRFQVERVQITLQAGDRIFIPTDGLMEQALPEGRPFGSRRTLKVLEKTRQLPFDECLPFIIQELDSLRENVVQDDDITMIYLEIQD
jgi:serine phosphatase RsbU (regulator of sigma subunit)